MVAVMSMFVSVPAAATARIATVDFAWIVSMSIIVMRAVAVVAVTVGIVALVAVKVPLPPVLPLPPT